MPQDFDWHDLPIRKCDRVVTMCEGGEPPPSTADLLQDMMREVGRIEREHPAHPLAGARVLYAHENMMGNAAKLADALGSGAFGHRPVVIKSGTILPGYIIAMDGNKVLGIIGPDSPSPPSIPEG